MDELVDKARSGDPRAEKQLFDDLLVRFRYLTKRRVGEEFYEDIVQDSLGTIFQKYRTETFSVSFLAWSYGVLKMKIGNHLQSKKRHSGRQSELVDDTQVDFRSAIDPNLKRRLIECLREIASGARHFARVLNLSYQGYTTQEICDKLNMTSNHYYVSLSRGRSLLAGCLERKGASV